ncbi:4Fe-4S binding protein [Desulfobacca acetoxidans]|uniref:4Fe-4S ferredoxin iron-sulfur binding domain-containing protein n=1 Tax=Desulfobacca acetoxidans (strain ATCC 700848 / DSM 11109 / ASRB2) TaxID=880072 RepID=F2NH19_DESAR|nr:4Fe-4S binding protein [Desulfobacca acetoxidans]AEB08790.1 4Fe-4S ferredoxin iron-sulfur binding domain-containing protein [Desulfobacca acetoxidans DSM 11109]
MRYPIKKRETGQRLELTLSLYAEQVSLVVDKTRCLKCEVCSTVCPRQAVSIISGEVDLDITIDPRICVLCEVCSHFCPTGAVTLFYNGQPKTILADHQGMADFYPSITIDTAKCPEPCPPLPEGEVHWCRQERRLIPNTLTDCPKNCRVCLDACPRQVIQLAEDRSHVFPQPELCLRCSQCLLLCRTQAIEISPKFIGRVIIRDELCPVSCTKCIDLCPVKAIVREGERVYLQNETCSLCGVCRNICDEGAITIIREEVVALPGEFSHVWDEAVARLTSGGAL